MRLRLPRIGFTEKRYEVESWPRREKKGEHLGRKEHRKQPNPLAAGQSGGDQGLSGSATADSESVEELVDEGNAFEAGVVFGVENVKDPSVSEVTTRQFPDHDVPEEYLNQDN